MQNYVCSFINGEKPHYARLLPHDCKQLMAACNQKTSRNPVVQYNEETVVLALNTLKRRGLVSTATAEQTVW